MREFIGLVILYDWWFLFLREISLEEKFNVRYYGKILDILTAKVLAMIPYIIDRDFVSKIWAILAF